MGRGAHGTSRIFSIFGTTTHKLLHCKSHIVGQDPARSYPWICYQRAFAMPIRRYAVAELRAWVVGVGAYTQSKTAEQNQFTNSNSDETSSVPGAVLSKRVQFGACIYVYAWRVAVSSGSQHHHHLPSSPPVLNKFAECVKGLYYVHIRCFSPFSGQAERTS